MSSTMNVKTEMKDKTALKEACKRLGIEGREGSFKLYASEEEGFGVFLPEWRYPVVLKPNGVVSYDTYHGQWGDEKELSKLTAYYGVEKAKLEARKLGHTFSESVTKQGELKLVVYM